MGLGLTELNVAAERAVTQFPALLIAANADRYGVIQETAMETNEILLLRNPVGYPNARELTQLLNHTEPELVLLDMADPQLAQTTMDCVTAAFPATPVIAIGARNLGDRTYVAPFPPAPEQLARLIHRAIHSVRGRREEKLLTFVPAKAGCGASTIALHTAAALASLGKRVLLIDADLHSGALGAMVQTSEGYSLQQLLRGISELDKFRLQQAVCEANGTDLLLSDGTPVNPLPVWCDYFRLLEVARDRYDVILVDLPEVVNAATQEFVQRSRNVYLVSTQETVPLRLASRRREELAACGIPPGSLRLVVNRWLRAELDQKVVEEVTRLPVYQTFDNDYRLVRKALNSGTTVPPGSSLGRAFQDFARKAIGESHREAGSLTASLGNLLGFGR